MALGKQFENTYWEDPETGETHSWRRSNADPNIPSIGTAPVHEVNAPDYALKNHQGLLFHPATSTGSKDDPLISPERRQAAAVRAVGGEDAGEYRSRVRRKINRRISANMAEKEIDLLAGGLAESGMPTREMESINKVSAYLNPVRKRGGGFAEEHSDTIMVGKQSRKVEEVVPEHSRIITSPSDTAIFNPKFWNWHDRTTDATDLTNSDILRRMSSDTGRGNAIHWQNPETGETIHGKEALNRAIGDEEYGPRLRVLTNPEETISYMRKWEDYDFEKHGPVSSYHEGETIKDIGGDHSLNIDNLRSQGFVPNIFPGAGNSSKKTHAGESFTVERDYMNSRGDYPSARVHTRFVPESVETEVVPESTRLVKKDYIDTGTLVHEIGHQQDVVMSDPYSHRRRRKKTNNRWESDRYAFADPMEEGLADGYRDKYHLLDNKYEDVLHDPSDPLGVMKQRGYTVGHPQWKNNTHRALYVASRIAARTGQNGREQYPSREELAKSLGVDRNMRSYEIGDPDHRDHAEHINTLALGHMLTTTPSLMKHLKGQGLESTGRKARAAYIDAYRQNIRSQQPEHPQLPGTEDW